MLKKVSSFVLTSLIPQRSGFTGGKTDPLACDRSERFSELVCSAFLNILYCEWVPAFIFLLVSFSLTPWLTLRFRLLPVFTSLIRRMTAAGA